MPRAPYIKEKSSAAASLALLFDRCARPGARGRGAAARLAVVVVGTCRASVHVRGRSCEPAHPPAALRCCRCRPAPRARAAVAGGRSDGELEGDLAVCTHVQRHSHQAVGGLGGRGGGRGRRRRRGLLRLLLLGGGGGRLLRLLFRRLRLLGLCLCGLGGRGDGCATQSGERGSIVQLGGRRRLLGGLGLGLGLLRGGL